MALDFSPCSFENHRRWVDDLVSEPPSPLSNRDLASLTLSDSSAEHVLRGSKSFAARSWKSRASVNSLQWQPKKENRSTRASDNDRPPTGALQAAPNAPVLGEIAANNQVLRPVDGPYRFRSSPTASLKRKKAEAIVKAHGSPTHVRVTAGGRIVPSEQSPLCHPRYGYSAVKVNGGLIKLAPNHPQGKAQWTQATQNGFVAQDVNGRLCQIVNGTILPLTEVDGALQLFIPAPNLNITQRNSSIGAIPGRFSQSNVPQRQSSHIIPPEPSTSSQINALELEYTKLEHDLKDIDKTEALHGRTMHKGARDALITRRRELVVAMDDIRKSLKSIRQQAQQVQAPETAPISMEKQQSASPPHSRLPPFLQRRQHQQNSVAMPSGPPSAPPVVYGPFFDANGQPQYPGPYGFQPTPSPDSGYAGQPWMMPPPALFVPPPPFDGSMSSTSLPYQQSYQVPVQQMPVTQPPPESRPEVPLATTGQSTGETNLPQNDGARSFVDLQKVSPRSHALPIKQPGSAVKSNLNPMSPAYRPGAGASKDDHPSSKTTNDRMPPSLSPSHQLQPVSQGPLRVVNTTDETLSPTKKSIHMHSSSISSFETADFFPRNTREFSTKKHDYPPSGDSEDKENTDPERHDSKADAPVTPGAVDIDSRDTSDARDNKSEILRTQTGGYKAPTVPPGTPADPEFAPRDTSLQIKIDGMTWERQSHGFDTDAVPNRDAHNVSPIKRRDWLFVEEHPEQQPSSSPAKMHSCQDELCVTSSPYDMVDFSSKSRDWVQGFQAGLGRNAIGADRAGEFLEGYCAGLLKTKPASNMASTGSPMPMKSTSRRPSPAPPSSQGSNALHMERIRPTATRPPLAPLENDQQSMDTLKQAVFAPQNENAILTPAIDGPHVNDNPFNLGHWAKSHNTAPEVSGFQLPARTSSVIRQHTSEERVGPKNEPLAMLHGTYGSKTCDPSQLHRQLSGNQQPLNFSSMSVKSFEPSSATNCANQRVSSISSMDSNFARQQQWPSFGHRIMSNPLTSSNEPWKSATSVGLTTGFFAQAQFDGTHDTYGYSRWADAVLTGADRIIGSSSQNLAAFAQQRPVSVFSGMSGSGDVAAGNAMRTHSKFKEGSLDGLSEAPGSPMSTAMSPNVGPQRKTSPSKLDKTKQDSPTKGSSPARAKFEHIAAKVGITVAPKGSKEHAAVAVTAGADFAPTSPSGKRRWRDVWARGGPKKEVGKEETV